MLSYRFRLLGCRLSSSFRVDIPTVVSFKVVSNPKEILRHDDNLLLLTPENMSSVLTSQFIGRRQGRSYFVVRLCDFDQVGALASPEGRNLLLEGMHDASLLGGSALARSALTSSSSSLLTLRDLNKTTTIFPIVSPPLEIEGPVFDLPEERALHDRLFGLSMRGHLEVIDELLSSCSRALARKLLSANHPISGATPLHYMVSSPAFDASSHGGGNDQAALLRGFVAAGASVTALAHNGSSPLHWAAGNGANVAITQLLALGADPLQKSYTWTRQVYGKGSGQLAIHWSAEGNHARAIEILSEASLGSVFSADERGLTARDVAEKASSMDAIAAIDSITDASYLVLQSDWSFGGAMEGGRRGGGTSVAISKKELA